MVAPLKFKNIVKNYWHSNCNYVHAFNALSQVVTSLNKEKFNNILKNKKNTLAKIEGLQK